ncbi:hypothetical protein ACFSSC_06695 [Corynebacterium mendelii]|uniref:Protein kinase domain-containing protein n=1 Tax=Corynebacterium mendelii TaxID=2765362 RepID=A0A939E1X0_9CORY|nr:hypothetical protein [Corynebacterium mendelii]MBN9644981.1 hypothetical protein [Corynebacterium mendelii]
MDDNDQNESFSFTRRDGAGKQTAIILQGQVGVGGEATIYRVVEPDRLNEVAKIFPPGTDPGGRRERKLRAMVANRPEERKIRGHSYLAWPKAVVEDGEENFMGVTLLYHDPDWCRSFTDFLDHDKDAISRLKVAVNLIAAVELAQRNGLVIGDLTPANVLVRNDFSVVFVDLDSAQWGDYRCGGVTADFAAPENLPAAYTGPCPEFPDKWDDPKNRWTPAREREKNSDWYVMAILLFMLVTDVRPFDFGVWTGADDNYPSSPDRRRKGLWVGGDATGYTWPKDEPQLLRERGIKQLFATAFAGLHGNGDAPKRPGPKQWFTVLSQVAESYQVEVSAEIRQLFGVAAAKRNIHPQTHQGNTRIWRDPSELLDETLESIPPRTATPGTKPRPAVGRKPASSTAFQSAGVKAGKLPWETWFSKQPGFFPDTSLKEMTAMALGLSLVAAAARVPTGFGSSFDSLERPGAIGSLIPAETVAFFCGMVPIMLAAVALVSARRTWSRYGRPVLAVVAALAGLMSFWAVDPVRFVGISTGSASISRFVEMQLVNNWLITPYLGHPDWYPLACIALGGGAFVVGMYLVFEGFLQAGCGATVYERMVVAFSTVTVLMVTAAPLLGLLHVRWFIKEAEGVYWKETLSDPLSGTVREIFHSAPLPVQWVLGQSAKSAFYLLAVVLLIQCLRAKGQRMKSFLCAVVLLCSGFVCWAECWPRVKHRLEAAGPARVVNPGDVSPGEWLLLGGDTDTKVAWQLYRTVPVVDPEADKPVGGISPVPLDPPAIFRGPDFFRDVEGVPEHAVYGFNLEHNPDDPLGLLISVTETPPEVEDN